MKQSHNHSTFGSEAGRIPCINIVNDLDHRASLNPLYPEYLYREGGMDNKDLSGLYLDSQAIYPRWCTTSPSIPDDFGTVNPMLYHDSHVYSPNSSIDGLCTREDQDDMLSWAYKTPSCSTESSLFSFDKDLPMPCHTLGSPASTSSYSDGSPSPLQLNEFTNVFDFDFSTALPSEFPPSSSEEPIPEALPSSLSRRRPSSCIPSRSPRNLSPADFVAPEPSRLASPCRTTSHDPKRRYPCLILGCVRRFTSQYTLKVHMEAHRPKPRVSFPCTLGCSEKFSRQHDRLRHEVAKHGKICEFSCSACGRFFSSNKTLGNHKCPVAQGQTRWVNV